VGAGREERNREARCSGPVTGAARDDARVPARLRVRGAIASGTREKLITYARRPEDASGCRREREALARPLAAERESAEAVPAGDYYRRQPENRTAHRKPAFNIYIRVTRVALRASSHVRNIHTCMPASRNATSLRREPFLAVIRSVARPRDVRAIGFRIAGAVADRRAFYARLSVKRECESCNVAAAAPARA